MTSKVSEMRRNIKAFKDRKECIEIAKEKKEQHADIRKTFRLQETIFKFLVDVSNSDGANASFMLSEVSKENKVITNEEDKNNSHLMCSIALKHKELIAQKEDLYVKYLILV